MAKYRKAKTQNGAKRKLLKMVLCNNIAAQLNWFGKRTHMPMFTYRTFGILNL